MSEMVANVDEKLGEMFLEDKQPTQEELMVQSKLFVSCIIVPLRLPSGEQL